MRIGNGYDVHRLVALRPLILGGVKIPFEMGLEGHSDGDALTHAIINAVLGACSLGDIGIHFPPGKEEIKGINSLIMLETATELLTMKNYRVINVDSMIICERPKLSSFYLPMREALSRALHVDVDCVSVKASTAEGLGVIGSGLAIAAQAVALVERIRK
ncbi:MAG TPA: 2-C-methyl-D-erythritol 2,4-cyclodiphosphate synthase [Planktothrix sp.]